MIIGIKVSNEIPYMVGYMVMLKDFKNDIVMYLSKGKRSLPNASFIDNASHLRRMFKSARNLWNFALLNLTFDIVIV